MVIRGTLAKMLRLCILLFFLTLTLNVNYATAEADPEALRECGDLHLIDMHTIDNARADYSNSKCMLTCYEGNKTLSVNAISEGYVCDQASQSKCRNGHCNGLEAVHQCSNLHQLDLSNFKTAGTEYSADLCSLKCVIEGKVASVNSVNEGAFCNSFLNGICHKGRCVSDSAQTPTVPTTIATTPINKKADLILKSQDLLLQADQIIKTQSGNAAIANEVTLVISGQTKVKELIAELVAANDDASIAKIELELSNAEIHLSYQLSKIHLMLSAPTTIPISTAAPTTRTNHVMNDLIKKGQNLLAKADEAIKKLSGLNRAYEVEIVQSEETKIKKIIADLQAATDEASITRLEHELSRAEHLLSFQLLKIGIILDHSSTV